MEKERYYAGQEEQYRSHEALCRRCGACCGAGTEDPCLNLVPAGDSRYSCRAYEERIGPQVTVSGKSFTCVPIRDLRSQDVAFSGNCPYFNQR